MPIPASPSGGLDRRTLREICTEQIQGAILDGTLKAGESLSDRALGAWLGVSRTPVREALADLERLGLVEMKAQSYTRIASPDPSHHRELTQALGAALGGTVRVAMQALTPGQHSQLTDLATVVVDCVDARADEQFRQSRDALLEALLDACPNRYLVTASQSARAALHFHEVLTRVPRTPNWDDLYQGYSRLHEALLVRDEVAAELAIECTFGLALPPAPSE